MGYTMILGTPNRYICWQCKTEWSGSAMECPACKEEKQINRIRGRIQKAIEKLRETPEHRELLDRVIL